MSDAPAKAPSLPGTAVRLLATPLKLVFFPARLTATFVFSVGSMGLAATQLTIGTALMAASYLVNIFVRREEKRYRMAPEGCMTACPERRIPAGSEEDGEDDDWVKILALMKGEMPSDDVREGQGDVEQGEEGAGKENDEVWEDLLHIMCSEQTEEDLNLATVSEANQAPGTEASPEVEQAPHAAIEQASGLGLAVEVLDEEAIQRQREERLREARALAGFGKVASMKRTFEEERARRMSFDALNFEGMSFEQETSALTSISQNSTCSSGAESKPSDSASSEVRSREGKELTGVGKVASIKRTLEEERARRLSCDALNFEAMSFEQESSSLISASQGSNISLDTNSQPFEGVTSELLAKNLSASSQEASELNYKGPKRKVVRRFKLSRATSAEKASPRGVSEAAGACCETEKGVSENAAGCRENQNGRGVSECWQCPPRGEDRIVLYSTSVRAVRTTFENCNAVRKIFENFSVAIDERDISMHSEFREELKSLLGGKLEPVPRLFIRGKYIGGLEEVQYLTDEGQMKDLIRGIPRRKHNEVCEGCGGVRFIPCFVCFGSTKLVSGEQVERCPQCNERGLQRCPVCE